MNESLVYPIAFLLGLVVVVDQILESRRLRLNLTENLQFLLEYPLFYLLDDNNEKCEVNLESFAICTELLYILTKGK